MTPHPNWGYLAMEARQLRDPIGLSTHRINLLGTSIHNADGYPVGGATANSITDLLVNPVEPLRTKRLRHRAMPCFDLQRKLKAILQDNKGKPVLPAPDAERLHRPPHVFSRIA